MSVACVVPGDGEAIARGREARFERAVAALGDLVGAVNQTKKSDGKQGRVCPWSRASLKTRYDITRHALKSVPYQALPIIV